LEKQTKKKGTKREAIRGIPLSAVSCQDFLLSAAAP